MYKKVLYPSLLAISVSVLSGCGTTPEELAMQKEMQQAFINKLKGSTLTSVIPQAQQHQQQKVEKPEVVISESELLAQKENVDQTGGPATFMREKDGILINGSMFHDYEGEVANLGADRLTGQFTYAIENFDGTFTLKYSKAGSSEGAVKLATVTKDNDSFKVKTVTGKSFTGTSVTPTSDGFIVGRAGSAFRYVIGSNHVKSISILDGYHIAKHQNGDVASTNFILLEKDKTKSNNPLTGLFESTKSLGNTLGFNKVDDYILLNINDSTIVPLDVSVSGKEVAEHSNCRSKGVYNECDNVSFKESLYRKDGFKNNSHYYWAIDWINTPSGPLAFYKTSTKVKVVDINKKQVHTVFSRTLGVNEFILIEKQDGTVAVKAQLGFSHDQVDNIEGFISTNKEEIEPMQQLGS